MLTVSAISLTFTLRSVKTILWTFSVISAVVTSIGRPLRGSSLVLFRPILNSATHRLTVVFDGEESPNVESSSFLISVAVKPFKKKYLITARISNFSILLKLLEAFILTYCCPGNKQHIDLKFLR
jgi:hypothetical protein